MQASGRQGEKPAGRTRARGKDAPGPAGKRRQALAVHLESAIRATFRSGNTPSIRTTAKALDVSVRTLQRHLREQDLSFREVVSEYRFREASRKLRKGKKPIAEIAASLGYSDASHFSRAFRRWSGQAPSTYRDRLSTTAKAGR